MLLPAVCLGTHLYKLCSLPVPGEDLMNCLFSDGIPMPQTTCGVMNGASLTVSPSDRPSMFCFRMALLRCAGVTFALLRLGRQAAYAAQAP